MHGRSPIVLLATLAVATSSCWAGGLACRRSHAGRLQRELSVALNDFCGDQRLAGKALPAAVPVAQLILGGYLRREDFRGFEKFDLRVSLSAGERVALAVDRAEQTTNLNTNTVMQTRHSRQTRSLVQTAAVLTSVVMLASATPVKAGDNPVRYQRTRGKTVEIVVVAVQEAVELWKRKVASEHPRVVFSHNGPGGVAIVPISNEQGGRSSLNFSKDPFDVAKGQEVWARFELLNVNDSDRAVLEFDVRADKGGKADRYRNPPVPPHSRIKQGTEIWLATPTGDDRAYYFLERHFGGDERGILARNPGAAVKITILDRRGSN